MADIQALNATFFAFKRRDRGGVLTMLTITYWVLAIVVFGVFAILNLQGITDYANWYGGLIQSGMQTSDPAAMQNVMPPASVMALGPAYLLLILVTYVLFASYEAGCLRWMVRGETEGLFGLSLGADTWRVYFGYWVWFFLFIALYLVFILLAAGIGVAFAMSSGGAMESAAPATVIAMFVGMLVFFGALIFFGVRFAPAAATSIARKRFAFFDAWTVSKGRFWPLFGSFFLLFLMFIVLYMIVGGGLVFGMMSTAQIGSVEPQSAQDAFQAFANPQSLAMLGGFVVVMVIASMMLYLAMFGVNARAAALALEEGKIKAEA